MTQAPALQSNDGKHHRFHFLDALRGLAAILVVLWHAPTTKFYSHVGHSNFMAVDFFFCLSGFVVSFSYEHRLEAGSRFRDFAAARVIRLYPTYLLAAVIGFALYPFWNHGKLPVDGTTFACFAVTQLVLVPDYFFRATAFLYPFDFPAWSLFFELVANFLYGLMVKLKLHSVPWLLAIAVVSLLPRLRGLNSAEIFDVGSASDPHQFLTGLCRVMLSFVLGVLALRLYRNKNWFAVRIKHRTLSALAIAVLLTLLLESPLGFLHTGVMRLLDIVVLFPCVVYIAAHITVPKSWTAPCALLGELSFPIYLLHVHATAILQFVLSQPFLQAHPGFKGMTMIAAIPVFAFVCIATLRYYELPIRHQLKRLYNQHTLVAAPPPGRPVSVSQD